MTSKTLSDEDLNKIKDTIKKEIKKELAEKVEKEVKNQLKDKVTEKEIKDVSTKVLVNLFRTLWNRHSFWSKSL